MTVVLRQARSAASDRTYPPVLEPRSQQWPKIALPITPWKMIRIWCDPMNRAKERKWVKAVRVTDTFPGMKSRI